jgi:hypothetical protein
MREPSDRVVPPAPPGAPVLVRASRLAVDGGRGVGGRVKPRSTRGRVDVGGVVGMRVGRDAQFCELRSDYETRGFYKSETRARVSRRPGGLEEGQ